MIEDIRVIYINRDMFYKEVFVGTLWRGKTKKMCMVLCRAPFGADNKYCEAKCMKNLSLQDLWHDGLIVGASYQDSDN